jgi:hypothetical protein
VSSLQYPANWDELTDKQKLAVAQGRGDKLREGLGRAGGEGGGRRSGAPQTDRNGGSGPVLVDVACSVCGKHVGYRELYPPGVPRPAARGGDDPRRRLDRHWEHLDNGDASATAS